MCGRYDGDLNDKWSRRDKETDKIRLILAGIMFKEKSTLRQCEIFMAKYYHDRGSLSNIADDFNITKQVVKEHLDKATDLLTDLMKSI